MKTVISNRSVQSASNSRRITRTVLIGLLSLTCLAAPVALLTGCGFSSAPKKEEQEENTSLVMNVPEITQVQRLDDKVPDGQYIVARVQIKNLGTKTLSLVGGDFALENITDNEAERYSQPSEKNVAKPLVKTFRTILKEKVLDNDKSKVNLYPKLQAERYFVFMVPADAKPDQYQITYTPLKVSAPLASKNTIINDHRNDNPYAYQ